MIPATVVAGVPLAIWGIACALPTRSRRWFSHWHLRETVLYGLPGFSFTVLCATALDVLNVPLDASWSSIIPIVIMFPGVLSVMPLSGSSLCRWVGPGWARDTMRTWSAPPWALPPVPTRTHDVPFCSFEITLTAPRMWAPVTATGEAFVLRGPSAADPAGVEVTIAPAAAADAPDGHLLHDGVAQVAGRPVRHLIHRVTRGNGHLTRHTWILESVDGDVAVTVLHADLDAPYVRPHIDDLLESVRPGRGGDDRG